MGQPSIDEDRLIGQIVGGRYEVVRLIGKGGMGAIYEVRNTRLGRAFALKTLTRDGAADPEVLARFRREADVIARIKHPNIVEVIDWEQLHDGSPAMVMEYLHGEDLAKRLEDGPLPWPMLARIADEVLAALSIAHANGVVHRDLKPQNIFLAQDDSGDERVKLLDFGISKVRDSKSFVTSDARLLGTPAYMAPEQAEGRTDLVGTHTDVWAMGAILHEMATGRTAFLAPSLPSVLYKVCHGQAESIAIRRPDAPAPLVELVRETLVRDVGTRIADAAVLRVRLREALRGLPDVRYSDVLPGGRTQNRTSGRRKRLTGSLDDTISTPVHGVTAVSLGNQPTMNSGLDLGTPTPSIIQRRKWTPVAVGIGGVALVMLVIAIVIATRRDKSAAAERANAVAPHDHAASQPADAQLVADEPTPADTPAAVAPVVDPLPKPPVAGEKPVRHVRPPPKKDPPKQDPPKQDPPKQDPPKQDPPKQDPPKQDPPKRKPCAKDDFECLYGDGT